MRTKSAIITFVALLLLMSFIIPSLSIVSFTEKKGEPIKTRTTRIVGTGQTYSTIQSALDASSSGDIVRVYSGTYDEMVQWSDKKISLIGNGSATTLIDTYGAGNGVSIVVESVTSILSDYSHVEGFTIDTSSLTSSNTCLWVNRAKYCTIRDVVCIGGGDVGIKITYAGYERIENCNSTDCGKGISLAMSPEVDVINCNFSNNDKGAFLEDSENLTFVDNKIEDNSRGIWLKASVQCEFYSNSLVGSGFYISGTMGHWVDHTITDNNTVNLKPVRYAEEQVGGTVSANGGQVILADCQDMKVLDQDVTNSEVGVLIAYSSGIQLDNITSTYNDIGIYATDNTNTRIENCSINNSESEGIFIEDSVGDTVKNNLIIDNTGTSIFISTSGTSILVNNTCNKSYTGIAISKTDECFIYNNTCNDNEFTGIQLIESDNNDLAGNILIGNQFFGESHFGCDGSTITGDRMENNLYGLYMKGSSNIEYIQSDFYDNYYGIYLLDSSDRLYLTDCTVDENDFGCYLSAALNCTFIGNTIKNSDRHGIYLKDGSNDNVIRNNTFYKNSNFGVRIDTNGWRNSIYHNSFGNNNNGGTQAQDNGHDNVWNATATGNYWFDWTSPDVDVNGIVDIPYDINIASGFKDYYPLTSVMGWPKMLNSNLLKINQSELYSVQYSASDIDTAIGSLIWDWDTNSTWLDFTDELLSGTPTLDDVGFYFVNISVSDGPHTIFTNFTVEVINNTDPEFQNKFPIITTMPLVTCLEDDLYYLDLNASDPDIGDVLTWEIITDAAFLSLNATSGVLSGIPQNSEVGFHPVFINVSDGEGGNDSVIFNLQVININDDPIINTPDVKLCYENDLYFNEYSASDIDPTFDILTWSIVTDAYFLTIGEYSGNLSGTPGDENVGTYSVNVTVRDGEGGSNYSEFSLEVLNVNDPPIIKNNPKPISMAEDTIYSGLELATLFEDIDSTDLKYSALAAEHLYVTVNETSFVTIIPQKNWNGVETIRFSVYDGQVNTTMDLVVTVIGVNDPPEVVNIYVPNALEGIDEGINITVTGNATDPDLVYGDTLKYRWFSNISGLLGLGSELNLSLSPGHHLITLNVSDIENVWAIDSGFIKINSVPYVPPVWNGTNGTWNQTNNGTGNQTDDDDLDPTNLTEEEAKSCSTWLYLLLVLLLVIIVVLFLALYVRSKKQKEKQEEIEQLDFGDGAVDYWDYKRWRKGAGRKPRKLDPAIETLDWEDDEPRSKKGKGKKSKKGKAKKGKGKKGKKGKKSSGPVEPETFDSIEMDDPDDENDLGDFEDENNVGDDPDDDRRDDDIDTSEFDEVNDLEEDPFDMDLDPDDNLPDDQDDLLEFED